MAEPEAVGSALPVGRTLGTSVGVGAAGAYGAYSPVPAWICAISVTEPPLAKTKVTGSLAPAGWSSVGTIAVVALAPGLPRLSAAPVAMAVGPVRVAAVVPTVTETRFSGCCSLLAMLAMTLAGALPLASATMATPFSLSWPPLTEVAAALGLTWRVAALDPAEQAARTGAIATAMTAATAPRRRLRLTAESSP
ncbi:hypothetical protein [Streptacidiphilus pinicola]|uniref:hypothetical protein n=1 Tax=Streptacidiphilus pinicola TaxID=2219663 RepID=UPI001A9DEF30|nr:hypothetical protein [Streptacidiphilus pinicola]